MRVVLEVTCGGSSRAEGIWVSGGGEAAMMCFKAMVVAATLSDYGDGCCCALEVRPDYLDHALADDAPLLFEIGPCGVMRRGLVKRRGIRVFVHFVEHKLIRNLVVLKQVETQTPLSGCVDVVECSGGFAVSLHAS